MYSFFPSGALLEILMKKNYNEMSDLTACSMSLPIISAVFHCFFFSSPRQTPFLSHYSNVTHLFHFITLVYINMEFNCCIMRTSSVKFK